ncbi:hypothetical protein FKM82_016582 [Ascaphus truei]
MTPVRAPAVILAPAPDVTPAPAPAVTPTVDNAIVDVAILQYQQDLLAVHRKHNRTHHLIRNGRRHHCEFMTAAQGLSNIISSFATQLVNVMH